MDNNKLPNPRLLGAIYFSLLAVIATLVVDKLLYVVGKEQILPTAEALLLAVMVAACFGALFAKRILYSVAPYRLHVFFWAVLMVVLAIPVYDLGLFFLLKKHAVTGFANESFSALLSLYLFILAYSFILAGLWLAVVAGISAIYLRTYLASYLMHSLHKLQRDVHHLDVPEEPNNQEPPASTQVEVHGKDTE
jgi:hypothetical protein